MSMSLGEIDRFYEKSLRWSLQGQRYPSTLSFSQVDATTP